MKRFRPYYKYLLPVRWHFVAALLCGLVYGIASGFGMPFFMKKALPVIFGGNDASDFAVPTAGGAAVPSADLVLVAEWPRWLADIVALPPLIVPSAHVLLFAVLLLPAVFAVRALAQFGNVYLINYVGVRVLEGVRVAVFTKLQTLHLAFFKKHQAGDLLSRVVTDTNHVKTVVVDTSNDLLIQPFTLLGGVSYVIYVALVTPGMTRFLLALLAVPLVVLPVSIFGKKLKKRSREMLAHTGNIAAVLTENLQSPREIRAYGLEERERERFSLRVRSLFRAQMKVVKYSKALPPLIEFLSAGSIAFAVYQAALARIDETTAVTLVGALYFCYEPLKKLGSVHNRMKEAVPAIDRLETILLAPVEVAEPTVPAALPAVEKLGAIKFENVTFAYDTAGSTGAHKDVLKNISVDISRGEIVALVGPSGAGKSTFANLVPRFYDPREGTVRVGGVDVRQLSLAALRRSIALVSQEPVLFNDTLFNNILLGRPDADRAAVERAAEQAGVLNFINQLPQGFDTPLGERGGKLSGGQRQRVAIARAFLKDAPVLILDEATSALDAGTEAQVQAALETLARGRTTLVIAHRFSTIRFATRILVFDKGHLVADGQHAELLETCPLFRDLWQRQHHHAG